MATFSVVALMQETQGVIERFYTHYIHIGATHVYIYIDGPINDALYSPQDILTLEARGVTITACDDAFWKTSGISRPSDHQLRQEYVYLHCYNQNCSDWLFVCDADEFLIDRIAISQFLDRIPSNILSVGILPVEAVWGPDEDINVPFGSNWFRRANIESNITLFRVYGIFSIIFRRGILGHTIGKYFVRKGLDVDTLGLHVAFANNKKITINAESIEESLGLVELAHFDAIGFERWFQKFYRRIKFESSTARKRRSGRRQIQQILFCLFYFAGKDATSIYFRILYKINCRQKRILETTDSLFYYKLF